MEMQLCLSETSRLSVAWFLFNVLENSILFSIVITPMGHLKAFLPLYVPRLSIAFEGDNSLWF